MGDGVVLAIHAVGLRTVVGESLGIGGAVVVLGIAGIDVALSAEARFEIDDLVGGHLPRQHPAEIAIAYPFASGHGTARVDGMSEVDVGIVRIGLVRAAVRAEAQGFGQRPAEAEVGAARGAILGLSGMLVNTVMEPRKRSVGRLVMMLTTPPAAPEP